MSVLIMLFVIFNSNVAAQDVKVFFVANDSLMEGGFLRARIIIKSVKPLYYPSDWRIANDSVVSNFGVFDTQLYDDSSEAFLNPEITIREHAIPDFQKEQVLISASEINLVPSYISTYAFRKPGLYRVRVKVWLSRFNRGLQDLYSNWSYFYIK